MYIETERRKEKAGEYYKNIKVLECYIIEHRLIVYEIFQKTRENFIYFIELYCVDL